MRSEIEVRTGEPLSFKHSKEWLALFMTTWLLKGKTIIWALSKEHPLTIRKARK